MLSNDRYQREAALFAVLADPARTEDARTLLTAALAVARERTQATKAYLAVYAPTAGDAPSQPLWDTALGCESTTADQYRSHFSRTILQRALSPDRGARPLHVRDAIRIFPPGHSVTQKQIASVVAAPFGGLARGVLCVQWRRAGGDLFGDEDCAFVERLGRTLGPIVDELARELVKDVDATIWWRSEGHFAGLVGRSEAFGHLLGAAHLVVPVPCHLRIVGVRGSGRTSLARAIHDAGRAGRPFVAVRPGTDFAAPAFVEAVRGGTVLITGLSGWGRPALAALRERMRALDPTEVRVVLEIESAHGMHLDDDDEGLVTLAVPSLSRRLDDVLPLLDCFGAACARARGLKWSGLDEAVKHAVDVISAGREIRDLAEAVDQAMALDPTCPLSVPALNLRGAPAAAVGTANAGGEDFVLGPYKDEVYPRFERSYLLWALGRCGWNPDATAVALDISRASIWQKIKQYEIPLPPRQARSR